MWTDKVAPLAPNLALSPDVTRKQLEMPKIEFFGISSRNQLLCLIQTAHCWRNR